MILVGSNKGGMGTRLSVCLVPGIPIVKGARSIPTYVRVLYT